MFGYINIRLGHFINIYLAIIAFPLSSLLFYLTFYHSLLRYFVSFFFLFLANALLCCACAIISDFEK